MPFIPPPPPLLLLLQPSTLIAVVWLHQLSSGALGALVFVNPPQKLENEAVDFATNPIYAVGSSLTVQWTSDEVPKEPLSLLLFQNGSPPEDAEHIFRNVTFTSKQARWPWTVVTNQTLDHSHAFSFSLFVEGKQNPEAIAREFNITSGSGSTQPPSPSATMMTTTTAQSSSSSSSSGSVSVTPPLTAASSSAAANGESFAPPGGGLSEGQKIGLGIGVGVGVPLSALLGFGCFLLWRLLHSKKKEEQESGARLDSDKYIRDNNNDVEGNHQQHHQQQKQGAQIEELQSTPLHEAETPPDHAARPAAELGAYEGAELRA